MKAAKQGSKGPSHFVQKSADTYKATKAAGDVKKNANVLPYAYIRLNPAMYKEKRRAQAIRVFKESARIGSSRMERKGIRRR